MGSLVAGSTPMKTLCLFLTVLATVHCDTVTRFQLLKTEGVIHAYDEQGVVVDGFKTKITVVKDETKDSIHNATKINDLVIDSPASSEKCNNGKKYIEDSRSTEFKSPVRSSPFYECDPNGAACRHTFTVEHTETSHFSAGITATWKGVITGSLGSSYSKSVTYRHEYSCDMAPGSCAYVTVSSHDWVSKGHTKEPGECVHETCTAWGECYCSDYLCDYNHPHVKVTWGKKLENGSLDANVKCVRYTTDKPNCQR